MKHRRIPVAGFLLAVALPLGGCATIGDSRLQGFFKTVYPLDAVAVISAGILIYQVGNTSPWDVEVQPISGTTYRVTLRRGILANGGEGESRLLFRQEAERITGKQSCSGYRILTYEERLETVYIGARRVAEGVVECVKA